MRTIHTISNKTNDINDLAAVERNLVRLEVFFEELNYAVTKDVPAYLVTLASDYSLLHRLNCARSLPTRGAQ